MNNIELLPDERAKLDAALLPEEEIQWVGHSEAFPLVCKETKSALLTRWIIAIVCMIALTIVYVAYVINSGSSFSIILELVIIIACAYFGFLVPVLDRRTLMNRALYCITNKRVLVLVADRAPIALNRSGLNSRCVASENGCVHLLFGASINTKPHKYRITTIVPQTDTTGNNSIGAIFYHIKKDNVPEDILTFS